MLTVRAIGYPDERPDNPFPCFGCGASVIEERGVEVIWFHTFVARTAGENPHARTVEAICGECEPKYTVTELSPFSDRSRMQWDERKGA